MEIQEERRVGSQGQIPGLGGPVDLGFMGPKGRGHHRALTILSTLAWDFGFLLLGPDLFS